MQVKVGGHTPGPWEEGQGGFPSRFNIWANGVEVAKVRHSNNALLQEYEANARLIAAAPELLAEAKQLLANARFADGQGIVLTQDCEALEAAIAKAEGRL